jgi:Mrp family chromosome partitioning ATPase
VQLLKRTEVPLLGMVLNRAEASKQGRYYYRRYYHYGYGYGGYGYGKHQNGYGRTKAEHK